MADERRPNEDSAPISADEVSALSTMTYYGRNWLVCRAEGNLNGMEISAEKIEEARGEFRRAERKRRRDAKCKGPTRQDEIDEAIAAGRDPADD